MSDIGHNNPPSERDYLREELASAFVLESQRAESLRDSLTRAPTAIFDAETATRAVLMAAQLGVYLRKVDELRAERKAPILDHGKALDAWFADMTAGLADGRDRLLRGIADYQTVIAEDGEDKAQIRTDEGPMATSVFELQIAVTDPAALPLRFLSPNERALKAAAKEGESIPGVEISRIRKTLIK